MISVLAEVPGRIGHPLLGIVIPAFVFAVSFVLTWWLFKHFSGRPPS